MTPVRQEDDFGCAVACVAFILHIAYRDALTLFRDGKRRAKREANFYCPEIVEILGKQGLIYSWERIYENKEEFEENSIVFIERCKTHRYGHFLCRHDNQWMDPWINLPKMPIRAGFRSSLPSKPTYQIFPLISP